MQDRSDAQWQVTCPCGWRTHGTRASVITTVQEHGRTEHSQELTEQQVMDLAVEYKQA